MSTGEFIHSLPDRFREERERLGFSRPELAKALDVTADTVKNWEGQARNASPNAVALATFHDIGADVLYILTGQKVLSNGLAQDRAEYVLSPPRQLAAKVATMNLSAADVELLLAIARRLNPPG